jgi:hydrogenase nickel incorporation protein HypA/HybF
MHEFSLIQSIVEIVLESASKHHLKQVSTVEIEVGKASGVIREAMEFAWEAARKETILDHTVLKIKVIPLLVRCNLCDRQYEPDEVYECCPGCGGVSPEVITGKELKVVSIET